MSDKFDPRKHLIQLKGKQYLETRYRIQWFREDHPAGSISTEIISLDPVLVKATIYGDGGVILATAHAGAVDKGNAVWSGRAIEKSETAAIGRALAHAGYGTQFAGVDDAGGENGSGYERRRQQPDDLRDVGDATRFIQHWRGQNVTDAEVLAALNVAKLSDWTKGRAAADQAVNAMLQARPATPRSTRVSNGNGGR